MDPLPTQHVFAPEDRSDPRDPQPPAETATQSKVCVGSNAAGQPRAPGGSRTLRLLRHSPGDPGLYEAAHAQHESPPDPPRSSRQRGRGLGDRNAGRVGPGGVRKRAKPVLDAQVGKPPRALQAPRTLEAAGDGGQGAIAQQPGGGEPNLQPGIDGGAGG